MSEATAENGMRSSHCTNVHTCTRGGAKHLHIISHPVESCICAHDPSPTVGVPTVVPSSGNADMTNAATPLTHQWMHRQASAARGSWSARQTTGREACWRSWVRGTCIQHPRAQVGGLNEDGLGWKPRQGDDASPGVPCRCAHQIPQHFTFMDLV